MTDFLTLQLRTVSKMLSFQQACSLLWLQLMLVWSEYSAVNAYKHTEMSQQVAEAQQLLNQGICLPSNLFIRSSSVSCNLCIN